MRFSDTSCPHKSFSIERCFWRSKRLEGSTHSSDALYHDILNGWHVVQRTLIYIIQDRGQGVDPRVSSCHVGTYQSLSRTTWQKPFPFPTSTSSSHFNFLFLLPLVGIEQWISLGVRNLVNRIEVLSHLPQICYKQERVRGLWMTLRLTYRKLFVLRTSTGIVLYVAGTIHNLSPITG